MNKKVERKNIVAGVVVVVINVMTSISVFEASLSGQDLRVVWGISKKLVVCWYSVCVCAIAGLSKATDSRAIGNSVAEGERVMVDGVTACEARRIRC